MDDCPLNARRIVRSLRASYKFFDHDEYACARFYYNWRERSRTLPDYVFEDHLRHTSDNVQFIYHELHRDAVINAQDTAQQNYQNFYRSLRMQAWHENLPTLAPPYMPSPASTPDAAWKTGLTRWLAQALFDQVDHSTDLERARALKDRLVEIMEKPLELNSNILKALFNGSLVSQNFTNYFYHKEQQDYRNATRSISQVITHYRR